MSLYRQVRLYRHVEPMIVEGSRHDNPEHWTMSEERKQEHDNYAVDFDHDDKQILILQNGNDRMTVRSLDDAEALRDALSAFIAFHKPRQSLAQESFASDHD